MVDLVVVPTVYCGKRRLKTSKGEDKTFYCYRQKDESGEWVEGFRPKPRLKGDWPIGLIRDITYEADRKSYFIDGVNAPRDAGVWQDGLDVRQWQVKHAAALDMERKARVIRKAAGRYKWHALTVEQFKHLLAEKPPAERRALVLFLLDYLYAL